MGNESVSLVVPLVPTLIMMWWCDLLPKWSRVLGLLLIIGFAYMYYRMVFLKITGIHWSAMLSYLLLGLLELVWGVYLWKDHRERNAAAQAVGD